MKVCIYGAGAVSLAQEHGVSAPRCELMLGLMRGLSESMQQPN